MVPGTCLRQMRERLGLTYREVERSSYELAQRRGRPDFILHVSRLADIENGGVTPSLHKLYSLCTIYHLDIFEVFGWYDVPFQGFLPDALEQPAPRTHLAPRSSVPASSSLPSTSDPRQTGILGGRKQDWGPLGAALMNGHSQYQFGFIGTEDHWMEPLLRPGAIVWLDPSRRRIENSGWHNEFDRPIYFIEIRGGYRCCWCSRQKERLILQPHPLSRCTPETPQFPSEAEVVGQVAGVAMQLFAPPYAP